MKFRIPQSSSKDAKAPEGTVRARQGDASNGTSPNRNNNDSGASSTGAASPTVKQPPNRGMEEINVYATNQGKRGSLEGTASSARNGRPISLEQLDMDKINNDATRTELAFHVPETPPRGSCLGKQFLMATNFSLGSSDDKGESTVNLPFPLAEDEAARHVVCQDSLRPWTYLLNIPGKNVRDVLIDAFNDWLRVGSANLAVIKQVVGYLHTGSLIIDDIEDESLTRRGEPAAHVVFGIAPALNAGNYVYFLAMEKVLTLQSTECVMVFTNEMLNLHRGQGRDIFWRTTSYIATEEEYRQMVCDKTGGLFRLAIRFMQLLSPIPERGAHSRVASNSSVGTDMESTPGSYRLMSPSLFTATSDFTVLADQLACYFQIRDDLINLASPKFHQKKGFCEDITEGKLSFIALHSLRAYRSNKKTKELNELLDILRSKTEDKKKIKRALTLMDDTGSFAYTVQYLKDLYKQVEASISSLGRNPRLVQLLVTIASEVDDCYDVRKRVIDAV